MGNRDREILRELAKEKLEISQLPIMRQRAEEWTKHNDLKGERPMLHFEIWTLTDPAFHHQCKCESEEARAIERELGHSILNHKMVGDDRVVTDEFICLYDASMIPFDLPVKKQKTEGIGFHIINQIEDLDSTEQIQPSRMTFDAEKSLKRKEFAEEQIGDILNVRMGMGSIGACLSSDVVHRMGMENMFMAMYDNPENFHYMMNSLSDDYVKFIKELERRGMLCANNKNDLVAQGSFGFCGSLPDTARTAADCWGYADSQETVGISADMFHEFFFPYYKKIADNFGLLSYGCCEPVHQFWEKSLSNFTNLRKISISPWCDEEYMGDALRGSGVIYQRKPSPNFVGVGKYLDEAAFREHIKKTVHAARGCKLEISFRDVYNLEGEPSKPRRAVEIAREEIEKM
ncbi:MAG: hypothetical protein LBH54_03490 [Clostridiales bacterium]|jgi:hypothetical protein|nr:hypothetical protein [Clostridiales bacterium]